jgi:nitrogen fixation protein NifB
MDKIEDMEIDYAAAMVKRAEVHAQIERELEIKQAASAARAELVAIQGARTDAPATRPVLMAVATKGGGVINEHFGHASEFLIYEASPAGVRFIGHRKTTPYCEGGDTCGDGESALDQTLRVLKGCEVVLCSKIGYEPWQPLEAAGIAPNGEHAMEPIEDAVAAVYQEMRVAGKLDAQAVAEQKVA